MPVISALRDMVGTQVNNRKKTGQRFLHAIMTLRAMPGRPRTAATGVALRMATARARRRCYDHRAGAKLRARPRAARTGRAVPHRRPYRQDLPAGAVRIQYQPAPALARSAASAARTSCGLRTKRHNVAGRVQASWNCSTFP